MLFSKKISISISSLFISFILSSLLIFKLLFISSILSSDNFVSSSFLFILISLFKYILFNLSNFLSEFIISFNSGNFSFLAASLNIAEVPKTIFLVLFKNWFPFSPNPWLYVKSFFNFLFFLIIFCSPFAKSAKLWKIFLSLFLRNLFAILKSTDNGFLKLSILRIILLNIDDKKFLTSNFFVNDWKVKNKNEFLIIRKLYKLLLLFFRFKFNGKDSKNKSSNNK